MTDKIMEALQGVRELAEKSAFTAEDREKQVKMNEALDKFEDANQKATQKLMKQENELKDAQERLEGLEAKFLRMPAGSGKSEAQAAELKALEAFMCKGQERMTPEEVKYLRTDVDTEGGFLTPSDYVREIIKDITEISPIRALARVRKTSSKAIDVPNRTSRPVANWTGEGESGNDSNSTYGMLEIPVHKQDITVPVTIEMLSDSAFNMESEINMDVSDAFAEAEGTAFVLGDGVKKPEGFMQGAGIQVVNSGVAADITADALIEMSGELKDGYNGVYVLNRRVLARIRTLKDANGQYLWQNGIANGLPSTINGDRYVSAIDMADIAANALPVAYGDFRRAYTIVDNTMMSVVRDPYSLKKRGMIEFTFHRRVGGQVVQPEAIKHLKCAV